MDNNENSFMSGKEKEKSKTDFSCSIYSKYPFTKHVPLIICEAVAVPTTIFNIKWKYLDGSTTKGTSKFISIGVQFCPITAPTGKYWVPIGILLGAHVPAVAESAVAKETQ